MKESDLMPKLEKPSSILDSVENQITLARKLEDVYEKRPEIGSFAGILEGDKHETDYTKEQIAFDEAYVLRVRNAIEEENRSKGQSNLDRIEGGFQLSEIMQAMVVDRMNKHWFKECKAIMTSDYDDLRVGIDAVMKHERGGYLGAAFDFTVSNQDKKIYEKLDKEWENNIKNGRVATVKYFEDPDTHEKGRLLVPKFIIGASKKDVEELAVAYLADDLETLENHPFKYVMLLQIEEQLQTILDFYETDEDENNRKKCEFAKRQYEKIQVMIRNLKREVHLDEKMHDSDADLYEYTKGSISLDMMKRFRIMREHREKTG